MSVPRQLTTNDIPLFTSQPLAKISNCLRNASNVFLVTPSLILIQLTYLVENADLEESDIETIGEASDPNNRAKTRRRCPLWKTIRKMGPKSAPQEQSFLQAMLDSNKYFK